MTDLAHPHEPRQRDLPRQLHPNAAALEAIAATHDAALLMRDATEELLELARRRERSARWVPVKIAQGTTLALDRVRERASASIGVLNPSPATVYIGIGGASPTLNAYAPSVPPGAGLVIPVEVADVELGAAAADTAAGDLLVYLLRFDTVQPFYFWRA